MTDTAPNRDAIDAVHIGRMTAAKTEYDSASGTFRGVYAQAERVGVNIPAAKKAMKLKAKGKLDEYLKEVGDVLHYARLLGMRAEPSQLDFIEEDPDLVPIEERAYQDGRIAGLLDESTSTNPHQLSTKAGQKWMTGWHQGQEERRLVLAMKPDDEDEPEGDADGQIDDPFSQAAE